MALTTAHPTSDELNNLGCVYALLADRDRSYWKNAVDALGRAYSTASDEEAKKRANTNLDVVKRARGK